MRITLEKIAKLANVSVSTASKALHGSKEVNEQTAAQVRDVALRYGYVAGKKEATLKNRKQIAPKIAILCPEIVSIHYTRLATGIVRKLEEKGASAQIFICDFDKAHEWESIRKCMESMETDGAVGLFAERFEQEVNLPFVCIGRSEKYGCVFADTDNGIERVIALAKERGHKRFAFLGESLTESKERAYAAAVKKCGIDANMSRTVISKLRFEQAGYDGMTAILNSPLQIPSFCLCAYDEIAIGAMKVLRERGIRIPDEVAVVGINDIPAAEFAAPSLSSIGFAEDALCEQAAETVLQAVLNQGGERRETVVPCELRIRESFG